MRQLSGFMVVCVVLAAQPAYAIETRPACITLNDVQIVGGVEKVVLKQLCRSAGSARYDLVQDSAFGAAVTETAFDRASNPELRSLRRQIETLRRQVQAGQGVSDAQRAELSRSQQDFVEKLAEKDRGYAEAIAQFRGAVSDISATPEGAEALAQYNNGHEVEAIAVLKRLVAANALAAEQADRAREALNHAAQLRKVAELERDARARGKVSTAEVLAVYEQVTRLDAGVSADWNQLVRLYIDADRLKDAERAAREARRTARTDQERANAAEVSGDIMFRIQFRAESYKFYEEFRDISLRISSEDPKNVKSQLAVARSFRLLGDVAGILGDKVTHKEDDLSARLAYNESLTIVRRLAAAEPSDAALQLELALNLRLVGEALGELDDFAGFELVESEGLEVARRLAATDPDNVFLQLGLSRNLRDIGYFRSALGDVAGSTAAYGELLGILRRLAAADPSNAKVKVEFVHLLSEQAHQLPPTPTRWRDLLTELEALNAKGLVPPSGQIELEMARINADFEVRRGPGLPLPNLADRARLHGRKEREISENLNSLGDLLLSHGELSAAGMAFAQRLAITQGLARAEPRNAQAQRDVRVTMFKLAGLPGATVQWSDLVAQLEALAAKGPLARPDQEMLDEARRKAAVRP